MLAVDVNKEELEAHVPKPLERIQTYSATPIAYTNYPRPSLWDECQEFLAQQSPEDHNRRIGRYFSAMEATGPLGADYWVFNELSKILSDLKAAHTTGLSELARRVVGDNVKPWTPPTDLAEMYETLNRHTPRFNGPITLSPDWMSPKLLSLVEVLAPARSPAFQGIIFTEQRHIAAVLAWILKRVSSLKDWLKPAALMGHGLSATRFAAESGDGMRFRHQRETVANFRAGVLNLLVATNVAEEGLDFQACHLIVRFDPLTTMVGYVQSRGRARRLGSEYIVMVEEKGGQGWTKYQELKAAEPDLKERYQNHSHQQTQDEEDDEDEDAATSAEIYTIPSTGATLTAFSSIPLIMHLCALIPRDAYSPVFMPSWEVHTHGNGYFSVDLTLPPALPINRDNRTFYGPIRKGRQSAKSSVAFSAMRTLHELQVFDDYLLPGRAQRGGGALDADGRPMKSVEDVPKLMEAVSRTPFSDIWQDNAPMWLHTLYRDGVMETGIVCGSPQLEVNGIFPSQTGLSHHIRTGSPSQLHWPTEQSRRHALDIMDEFWARGSSLAIPAPKPKHARHSTLYFLVPLETNGAIAYDQMIIMSQSANRTDWIDEYDTSDTSPLVELSYYRGRLYMLRQVHFDLTPLSIRPEPDAEGQHKTYLDYWQYKQKWMKPEWRQSIYENLDLNQPLVEVQRISKHLALSNTLGQLSQHAIASGDVPESRATSIEFAPLSKCEKLVFSSPIFDIFRLLPSILRHASDVFRAQLAQNELNLPPLDRARVLEALTVPSAAAGFSYQRLETLGDSVLKLATSVHVFTKFPHRHEGQLDILRMNSVNNAYLLSRARELETDQYLIGETPTSSLLTRDKLIVKGEKRYVAGAMIARKCMQDNMEAMLGGS